LFLAIRFTVRNIIFSGWWIFFLPVTRHHNRDHLYTAIKGGPSWTKTPMPSWLVKKYLDHYIKNPEALGIDTMIVFENTPPIY